MSQHNMVDYDKTRAEFKWEKPEYFNFARDVIDKWARDPNKLAMLWVDDEGNEVRKTFFDFSRASRRAANVLREQGVKYGDVVVVILPRLIEWWEINLACLRLGAVISPGTTQL
ncbi:AMP-binding protein, partial [Desulfofundulus sp.]|uniref:AMP-binding protein n=1 Tax=Desulfofundulus sp. TaxID=2282750 RepID=UPI003C754A43